MKADDLKYSKLSVEHLKFYENRASNFSGRFLRWFLEQILRLDEFEADDAAVDAKHDKGVDAIYVDDVAEVVYIVQAKTKSSDKATLGDTRGGSVCLNRDRPWLSGSSAGCFLEMPIWGRHAGRA